MKLTGSLSPKKNLSGSLSQTKSLEGSLSLPRSIEGTSDYEMLDNKPKIETVTLIGDKTFEDLGLSELTGTDLINILKD